MNFHAIFEIPRGEKHPHALFGKLPELTTFAKTDKERKVLSMLRAIRLAGSPYILPPGTPKMTSARPLKIRLSPANTKSSRVTSLARLWPKRRRKRFRNCRRTL
jgi:hypothetical protein